jgi:HEAT repeat protein
MSPRIQRQKVARLANELDSNDEEMVSQNSLELENMGAPAVPAMLELWVKFNVRQKQRTLDILSRVDTSKATKKLIDIFELEDNPAFRASLITLIGQGGAIETIPFLSQALKSGDRRIRANAVEAIAKVGGSTIVELLVPLLKDPSNRVKANTAKALWGFDEVREKVKQAFDEMLKDDSKWMRASAYFAFGEIRVMDFFQDLLNALGTDDEDIARNVVVALVGYAEKYGSKGQGDFAR